MLFQSLLYCSNQCTSLHFKILKSHTKTLKIRPYMFQSPLKPSSEGPWPYFARLLNWNVKLHLLWRVSICGCMSIHSVRLCVCVCVCVWVPIWSRLRRGHTHTPHTHTHTHTPTHTHAHTHTHRRNELTYSHIPTLLMTNVNQHSNSVT
jgi:hypothetical protein